MTNTLYLKADNIIFSAIEDVLKDIIPDYVYNKCVNAVIGELIEENFVFNDYATKFKFVKSYYKKNIDKNNVMNIIVFEYNIEKQYVVQNNAECLIL